MKSFKGKTIYNPSGKAGEYSYWAVNFYNGCSAKCEYCYNRHGVTAKILGADTPTLKKCLKDVHTAYDIFLSELKVNSDELRKHGLFFNFVSDPMLRETIALNTVAMRACINHGVPVKVLTKQTWWLEDFLQEEIRNETLWNLYPYNVKRFVAFGFTLTGHDELEPGAAPNEDRIRAIKVLYDEGFKTWASIEPIIDINDSWKMIEAVKYDVDLVKVGLQSGKTYSKYELKALYLAIINLAEDYDFKVYFKDSFVAQASKIDRETMPGCCVTRDYNIFNQ